MATPDDMEQRLLDATERAVRATSNAATQAERLRRTIEDTQRNQRREWVERLLAAALVVILASMVLFLVADHHSFNCESDAGPTTATAAVLCDVSVPLHAHEAPGETRVATQLCQLGALDEELCDVLEAGEVPRPLVAESTHAIARTVGLALYAGIAALAWWAYPRVRRRAIERIESEDRP